MLGLVKVKIMVCWLRCTTTLLFFKNIRVEGFKFSNNLVETKQGSTSSKRNDNW